MIASGALAAFSRAVGGRLAHVTARSNLPGIHANGLMCAEALARRARIDPATLALRRTREKVGPALLNHQLPIVHGIKSAQMVLERHDPRTWAAQLDTRVFLWSHRRVAKFAASFHRHVDTAILWIDPARLAAEMWDHIDLSPLNSGSFEQGASKAVRGDWLYVPLSQGLEAFRTNRIVRGHATNRDTVAEVSLRAPLAPDLLQTVLIHD